MVSDNMAKDKTQAAQNASDEITQSIENPENSTLLFMSSARGDETVFVGTSPPPPPRHRRTQILGPLRSAVFSSKSLQPR